MLPQAARSTDSVTTLAGGAFSELRGPKRAFFFQFNGLDERTSLDPGLQ
jgi:hypothetical protein